MSEGGLAPPADSSQLTPAWLTAALRQGGWLEDEQVIAVDVRRTTTGVTGEVSHLVLDYSTPPARAPATLVAKLPRISRRARHLTAPLFAQELRFYHQLAPQLTVRTPQAYYGRCDPDSGRAVLLLQDLSEGHPGDNLAGCSHEEARLGIIAAARLHAHFLARPQLDTRPWDALNFYALSSPKDARAAAKLVDKVAPVLPSTSRELLLCVLQDFEHLSAQLNAAARTVIHGDYRAENLIFFPAPEPAAYVLDWQATTRGPGIIDVAQFVVASLTPAQRQAYEEDLLQLYQRTLQETCPAAPESAARQRELYELAIPWSTVRLLYAARFLIVTRAAGRVWNEGVARLRLFMERTLRTIEEKGLERLLPSHRRLSSRRSAPVPAGAYADIGEGLRIHYHDVGQGPPVVFLHGSGIGANGWSNFSGNLPAFAAAGYRCLVPDTLGFGYSSKPEQSYDLETLAGTLHRFLAALDLSRVVLVGNSHGGALALRYAVLHPQRVMRLVLLAPAGLEPRTTYSKMPGMRRTLKLALRKRPLTREDLRDAFALQLSDPARLPAAVLEQRFRMAHEQSMRILRSLSLPDLSPELTRLTCPVLVCWGRQDRFCPPTGAIKLAEACADAWVVLLDDCGHWVMIEQAERFQQVCLEFLGRSPGAQWV